MQHLFNVLAPRNLNRKTLKLFFLLTDLQYEARGCGQGKVKQATGKASA